MGIAEETLQSSINMEDWKQEKEIKFSALMGGGRSVPKKPPPNPPYQLSWNQS